MEKYDYLIVGSGLFGSIFVCEMTKKGRKCLVLERRNHIAGNIYTEEQEDIQVHKYGAHIFHTSNLSIIEALSTGVPIIMSNNYGHKYYENKNPLIHTYDALNPNELKKILLGDLQNGINFISLQIKTYLMRIVFIVFN